MPVPVVMTIVAGRLAVSLTEPATAADLIAYDCQTVSAKVTANASLQTVAATFCAPESQAPAATGYQLDITALEDWSAGATSFFAFAFENDTSLVYWELALDTGTTPIPDDVVMHGTAYCVALGFGGDAGTPLQDSVTWPIVGKPSIGAWPVTLTAGAGEEPAYADAGEAA